MTCTRGGGTDTTLELCGDDALVGRFEGYGPKEEKNDVGKKQIGTMCTRKSRLAKYGRTAKRTYLVGLASALLGFCGSYGYVAVAGYC